MHQSSGAASGSRPLVTFALFAYNQEEFIREAVESALAQDYSPLEIILSDDCSTDRTYLIMEEAVKDYAGPHRIVVNRNSVNLGSRGIGLHVNRVLEMARGELLVFAAGDDISLPFRTKTLVDAWSDAGRPSGSLHSAVETLSDDLLATGKVVAGRASFDGVTIQECIRLGVKGVLGASHAVTKDLFDRFGPLPAGTLFEDRTLAFRSLLAGKVLYCPKVLVKYRLHGESITGSEMYENPVRWRRWIDGTIAKYQSFLSDYQLFMAGQALDGAVLSEINKGIRRAELSRNLVSGKAFERAIAAMYYSKDFKTSDRIAFVLQRSGLKHSLVYRQLSWIWRLIPKSNN